MKGHFDELCQDECLADAESYFRMTIFSACLDILISQPTQRFIGLTTTVDTFKLLQPETLYTATDDELLSKQASYVIFTKMT